MAEYHSLASASGCILDLDDAFSRFFHKQCKKPKFKKKHECKQSFTYPQGVKVDSDIVLLPKIGRVRFQKSCEIEGVIKRATIRKRVSGWSVSLLCEIKIAAAPFVEVTPENSLGIDLGSVDLVTSSRAEKIPNPRHYRSTELKLKREQRRLSRKQMGSNNQCKQKRKVALLHERIANRRKDCLHKISRQLVDENQAIFAEDLNVLGIAKRMGKSVGDAGWSELVRQLHYKSKWAGKTFLRIGRYCPSSKKCSCCGFVHHELELSERTWLCPACGVLLDRDVNAAINIHREGLVTLAAGHADRINACGEPIGPAKRARLGEARISRLEGVKCQTKVILDAQ